MYHLDLNGSHYEIGKALGSLFKANEVRFPLLLDDFQRNFGRESQKLLKSFFPEVIEEIKGLTDEINVDNELFTSWMMCMGCCLYNIDPTSMNEIRGCTAFAYQSNGKIYYGRNNDLPPFLEPGCKSLYYSFNAESSFILNTSSFINGEEGINNRGLVVAMTFVTPYLEQIRPGFNSVFIVRYLLEKCSSTSEAIEMVKKVPIASSCNILLCDKAGEMTILECTPDRINIRKPDLNEVDEPFVITVNNFIGIDMKKYVNINAEDYASEARYRTVKNALQHHTDYPLNYTKKLLSGKCGFICQYEHQEQFKTVWSSIFDITGKKVFLAEGSPENTEYVEIRNKNI